MVSLVLTDTEVPWQIRMASGIVGSDKGRCTVEEDDATTGPGNRVSLEVPSEVPASTTQGC